MLKQASLETGKIVKTGRPPKYESPEEMQRLIDLYFIACRENRLLELGLDSALKEDELSPEDMEVIKQTHESVPLISGLAYLLDMTTETLRDYGTKDEFSATVKKAKQRVEMNLEQRLAGTAVTGSIFSLKNNFGWKDKTEQEVSGSFNVAMPNQDAGTL